VIGKEIAVLDLINRYCHGYVVLPAIVELNKNNFFDSEFYRQSFSLHDVCHKKNISVGYLSVVFRSMLAMNLVQYDKNSGLWTACDQGEINRIPDDLPQMLRLASGRCLEDESLSPQIVNWIDRAINRWDFGEHFIADFIEGLLVIPLLLELKKNGFYCPKEKNLDLTNFSSDISIALKKLFVAKGWGEEKRNSVSVSPAGAYLIDRLMNAGTVMSYAPMLSKMDALLYGDSDSVFTRDEETGHENHIERTLNVVASGFQHEKYFKDIEKTILSIFDTHDFLTQPNYIADMGCGDGSLLKKVYEIILEKSARGKVLKQFPLTLIGVDYNDKALVATAQTLEGFPFITIHGDIGDPAQLEVDLKSKVTDVADILHVRSFLDHDRPFIAPLDDSASEDKKNIDWQVLSVGSGGGLVEPAVAIQSLVEHFSRWADLKSKHGMLVLEVHSVPTIIAGEYMDECESLHFDAYHAFSRQHLVDAEHFSIAASEAGLFPDLTYSRFYSKVMPYKRITLNMLQKRDYSIRYVRQADLPALAGLNNVVMNDRKALTQQKKADLVENYPQGQYVLISGNQVVAACFTVRAAPGKLDDNITILGVAFSERVPSACQQMLEFVVYNSQLKSGVEIVEGQNEIERAIESYVEKKACGSENPFPSIVAGLSSYEQSYPTDAAKNTINAELEIAKFAGRRLLQWIQAQGFMLNENQHYKFESLLSDLNIQPKYYRLLRALLNMLARQQVLSIDGDVIVTQQGIKGYALQDFDREALEFEQHVSSNYPGIIAFWQLTKRCLSAYGQILSGKIASNDVVFQDGSMELFAKIFKGNPVADYYNELLAQSIVAMLLAKRAKGDHSEFRVLEVGAGTGGATEFVLRKLSKHSNNITFCYTDISSSFTRYGRERFAKKYPWVRFQKLDVSKDPELQGFELNSYDAVFAFNVLHDTDVIHTTLGWINRLLKVGGVLLMNEYTRVKDMLLFSGGLLHGLWIYKDPEYRIEHSCFLSVEQWEKVAKATGYNDFSAFGDPHLDDVNNSWQSVMLCHKTDEIDMPVIDQVPNVNSVLQNTSDDHLAVITEETKSRVSAIADEQEYDITLEKVSKAISRVMDAAPVATIEADKPIMELGLDSIELVELKSLLNKEFVLKLATSEFFTHSTPSKIARHICTLKAGEKPLPVAVINERSNTSENKAQFVEQLKELLSRLEKDGLDQKIGTDVPFMEMGLDSIELVELRSLINKTFSLKLNTTTFFKFTTVNTLAEHLVDLLPSEQEISNSTISATEADQHLQSVAKHAFNSNTESTPNQAVEAVAHKRNEYSKLKIRDEDIAIVGLALHFPGEVNSREQLWELLSQGENAVRPLSDKRWVWPDSIDIDGQKSYLNKAGFASDIERFDADFFHISPKEAELMDPQQRMVMQLAWQALEDAGYKASSLRGSNTGVYIGACHFDYSELAKHSDFRDQTYVSTGTNSSLLANRISYFFDLQGPSMMIDTACSSSLVAVHDAVKAIRRGDCEQALVGGVNLICTPTNTLVYDKANILSKDNRCATFDSKANGFVRGEGGAIFMIKPLKQAVADGDLVSAVIKGAAVNHGGQATSLTAPNPDAQAKLIVKALEDADSPPESISYIEAHGTGTALGDPVEVLGLKQAFSSVSSGDQFPSAHSAKCGLGTVKSNIGHLEGAAGVAGMMKVIVSLSNKSLPKSLHYQEINPEISFSDTPFYVVDSFRPWPTPEGALRRAGVSSFGFGGANGHVILEEHQDKRRTHSAKNFDDVSVSQLLLFSAKSTESLMRYAKEFKSYLSVTGETFGDIAYSLAHTREHLNCRLALFANNKAHAVDLLDRFIDKKTDSQIHYLNSDSGDNTLNNIFSGVAGKQLLDLAITERSFELIAQAWIAGVNVDYSKLYIDTSAKRVRLPVYQFSGEKYWLYPSHTSVSSNSSGLDSSRAPVVAFNVNVVNSVSSPSEYRFSVKLFASHPIFAQHVIDDLVVCPGVMVVELVLASLRQIWPENSFSLQNMVWRKPIIVLDQDLEIFIEFSNKGDGQLTCLINGGDGTYCQVNVTESTTLSPVLDFNLVNLKQSLPLTIGSNADVTAFYTGFRQRAIFHGDYYQGIKKIWGTENEILVHIALEQFHLADQFEIHPVIADCALQAISGLISQQSKLTLLPFSIDAIRILSKPTREMYAYAVKSVNGLYDVSIFSKDGQCYAVLNGIKFRPYNPQGSGDDARNYMLTPAWQKTQSSEPAITQKSSEPGKSIAFFSAKDTVFDKASFNFSDIYTAAVSGETVDDFKSSRAVDFNSRQSIGEVLKKTNAIARVYFCATRGDTKSLLKCFNLLQALTDVVSSAQSLEIVIATFDTQRVVDTDIVDANAAGIAGLVQCFSKEYGRWRIRVIDFNSAELAQEKLNFEATEYFQNHNFSKTTNSLNPLKSAKPK